ncbi:NUDIX hydrolase [Thermodesulfobacteriota bacterium]
MLKCNDPRMLAPQCHSLRPVKTIHENKWFALRDRGGYYLLEYHRPQVTVLPIVDNHSIVMVKVKRPVLVDSTLELPAGGANKGESPALAAARELKEETGIRIERLDRFHLSPPIAISSNRYPVLPWIYEINISRQEFDCRASHDDEITEVECIEFEQIKELIFQGGIYVSLPIAIISRFLFSKAAI